jgi:hypothetical protein
VGAPADRARTLLVGAVAAVLIASGGMLIVFSLLA